ncbi:class I SAM-dependent methyltransferase [Halorubellus sp. JP-L1]|uniref:class I SAM-dependent methyltransferase n=1 Tax=Halorubellus sp. JP-L1 TaxID=2715753 RepID=UPI00140BB9BF|nr:class I SAM-dependent methyltransferase [Halorubellus sp. JP-L1]NHN41637.1 class I SAM-dependent methyltransferase [Halorubellus sp. JP-L1]
MDELARTTRAYETDAGAYVEKYETESIAARFWDDVDPKFPGPRLLDVGCGPGPDTATFTDHGYDVVGFDLTTAFLQRARDTVDAPFVRGDMRTLPFQSNAFDGVWACASLLHVPRDDVPGTLREFRRVLDAPGTLVATLKRQGTDRHSDDDRHFERYTPAELRALATDADYDDVTVTASGDRWLELTARIDA